MAMPTCSYTSGRNKKRELSCREELLIQTLQEGSCIYAITGTSVFTAKISRVTYAFMQEECRKSEFRINDGLFLYPLYRIYR